MRRTIVSTLFLGVVGVFLPIVLLNSPSEACSRLEPEPTLDEIYSQNKTVFTGTITEAELIDVRKVAPELLQLDKNFESEGLFFARIHWRVEKIYKGNVTNEGTAVAVVSMCEPLVAIVGFQYIFAVSPFKGANEGDAGPFNIALQKILKGTLGIVDPEGTADGVFGEERYAKLVAAFDKLSTGK